MIFVSDCVFCGEEFQDTVVVNRFCSEECQKQYYELPLEERQVLIKSNCPSCKKDFEFMWYKEGLCNGLFANLNICPECLVKPIFIRNSYVCTNKENIS